MILWILNFKKLKVKEEKKRDQQCVLCEIESFFYVQLRTREKTNQTVMIMKIFIKQEREWEIEIKVKNTFYLEKEGRKKVTVTNELIIAARFTKTEMHGTIALTASCQICIHNIYSLYLCIIRSLVLSFSRKQSFTDP